MLKRLLGLVFILAWVVPVIAQDDTPQAAIDAALTAVENQFDERATNFTFQFLGDTNDSSLGCPLITGEELPFTTSAIRVDVIYPNNATYTVYTSISGQITLLCDSKFDADLMINQLNADARCNATPTQTLPAYEAPNTTLEGVFAADAQPYPVYGVSSDGGWYQVASDTGLGWIDAASVVLAGDCTSVPTTSIANPLLETICFVEPQGGFTNVRATPEGNLVGRMYENEVYQVTARNTAGTWFYVEPAGWVSNTVTFTLGDCNAVTVNDNAIGVGFSIADERVNAVDTAGILQQFSCPADYAGYLIPRIGIGDSTAQVEAGTVPNTLRAFPSVNDTEGQRIGVIQPQRVIDRVVSGPACNQGFVWWLVEIDGTVGWTAESNQSSDDYFLEPTGAVPSSDEPITTPLNVSEMPLLEVLYNTDGSRLFALTTQQGFGDGQLGVVMVIDGVTGDSIATIEEPSGIVDIDFASEANAILVAAFNGIVTVYDATTFEQVSQFTGDYNSDELAHLEITPDGQTVVIGACYLESCTSGRVDVVETATGDIVASTPTTARIIDIDINPDGTLLALVTPTAVTVHQLTSLALLSQWDNSDNLLLDTVLFNLEADSMLLTGCNDADCTQGRIALLSVADGSVLGVVPSHQVRATAIDYNSDYTRFISLADDSSEVIERNAATGEETQRFSVNDAIIVTIAYNPQGRVIAAGTIEGRIIFLTLTQ